MLRAVPDLPEQPKSTAPSDEEILRWAVAYLRHAPVALTVREINRLIAYQSIASARGPVLDVGCGDGFWWSVREDHREIYGIDISAREVTQARTRIHAELVDVSREVPYAGTRFAEIIGNCSLEHVPDIDAALSNLRRAAADDGRLILFVPTPRWAYQGKLQGALLQRAPRLAMAASGALNGFFQHWHLYDAKVWQRLLERHGWRVESSHGLGSSRSEFVFRLALPPAFGAFVAKSISGFYPSKLARLLPDAAIEPLAKLVRWAVSDPIVPIDSPHAYEYMLVATASDTPDR